jgi:hypothetical protein
MNVTLLIILLAHGGFWFGGENAITVKWATPEAGTPASVLVWKLSYGTLQVAAGEAPMAGAESTVKLNVPAVRVATAFQWSYELRETQTGRVLERGVREIRLIPPTVLQNVARGMKGRKIVVLEQDKEGITKLLERAGIESRRVGAAGDLQLAEADIILVGEDELPENPAVQEALLAKARKGAGVVIFSQRLATHLGEWEVRPRKIQPALTWRLGHTIFTSFAQSALDAWAAENPDEARALALPMDANVLELGNFTRETPGNTPVPVDALAATQTLGDGRIVFWQVRIASWKNDPRAQLLLGNILDYLRTRPEPTVPQAKRQIDPPKPAVDKQLIGAEP